MNTDVPGQPNSEDMRAIREMWRHEDELTEGRVTWLAVFNSFFVGALAAGWGKNSAHPLLIGICVFGFLVSISAGISLWYSHKAMDKLSGHWEVVTAGSNAGLDKLLTGYIRQGRWDKFWLWLVPWKALPILFAFGWLLALGYELFDQ